jgi:O-antigen/teichoic acid export membrane protein
MILFLAKILEKGIMLLFFMIFARVFGKEAIGEFSYYSSIVVMVYVLLDIGGEFYQIREFSKSESIDKFNTICLLKTLIFIILFIILYFFNNNLYLLILFASYYLLSIISVFRSFLYNNGLYIIEAKYTIFEKIVFIVLIIINIISFKNLLIIYLTFVISRFIYLFILFRKFYNTEYIEKLEYRLNINFAKQYIYNSWSYILHALLVVVFVQVDIIMLKQMNISFEKIGLYSASLKIYGLSIIFADILFKQYYPTVAQYIQNNQIKLLKNIVLKVQNTNLYFSIFASLLIMLFSKELIIYAFGENFIEAKNMLILLSIIIIFRYSMYTYTSILSSSNLNYIKLYTSITCVIINIIMNYFFIPKYGVYGAIYATIITEFILVVLYKISSYKIIFTNYITLQEIFIIFLTLLSVFILLNIDISLKFRFFIGIFILFLLLVDYNNIKNRLSFTKETNNV